MANPYAAILSHPGALAFSATGLVARLPLAMTGLGIILMIEHTYGSYGLAGAVSAVYVVTMAAAAPVLANLVDKYGQARIMRPALAIFNLGLAALVAATITRAPAALLLIAAAIAGTATGSIGALVRARWSITVADARELHTAYALESALDEVVFVIGPVLATILATTLAAPSAIIAAIAFSLIGGFWFLSLTATEPPAQRRTKRKRELWEDAIDDPHARPSDAAPGVLTLPAMWSLIVVMACIGVIFGATDVSTVAVSKEFGRESLAGVLLGIFAFGSLISGLLYGARVWNATLTMRLAIGVIALAAGSSLFLFIHSLLVLGAVLVLIAISTAMGGLGSYQALKDASNAAKETAAEQTN